MIKEKQNKAKTKTKIKQPNKYNKSKQINEKNITNHYEKKSFLP